MLIRIGQFDITECWDGVLYKKLSRYPQISAWELQTVSADLNANTNVCFG